MDLPDKSVPQPREKKGPVIPLGSATPVARPAGRRFLDYVFAESPRVILVGVITQTFVPQMKAAGEQALNGFIHGMFWGGGKSPNGFIQAGTILRGNGVVVNDYNAMSNPSPTVIAASASGVMTGPYQDLTVNTRELAEHLLSSLIADVNQYRVVSVADLYEAAALTPGEGHSNYGWYGLDGARIVQDSKGYKLMLPKPVRI